MSQIKQNSNPTATAGPTAMSATPTIKFIREERDCLHNKEGRGRTIYDFRVEIDGKHRATFASKVNRRGYELAANVPGIYNRIKRTDDRDRQWPIDVNGKAEFQATVESALADGLIPTVAGLAELKAADDRAKQQKAAAEAKEQRAGYIRMAAPGLYAALKAAVAQQTGAKPEPFWMQDARAAIAKAETL